MDRAIKDVLAGLVFIGFGLAFAVGAASYDIGTPLRMGPGYFPLVLGGLLVLIGITVIAKGLLAADAEPIGTVPWRALVLILAAILFFGATVRGLGLVPSVLVVSLMAAFASQRTTVVGALVIAVGIVLGAVVVGIWIDRGFGQLSEERLAVLVATLIVVGIQVIFTSFLISILGLRKPE